jgi:hypothetical protein
MVFNEKHKRIGCGGNLSVWSFQDAALILKYHPIPTQELLRILILRKTQSKAGNTISFGFFNNNIIICDSDQLTEHLDGYHLPYEGLASWEKILTDCFSESEILSVACASSVNWHMYSLVKNGKKLRYKCVYHGQNLKEFGSRFEEEESIYARSAIINGERLFKSDFKPNGEYEYKEDLMFNTVFRKYKQEVQPQPAPAPLSHNNKSDETPKPQPDISPATDKKNSWLTGFLKKIGIS